MTLPSFLPKKEDRETFTSIWPGNNEFKHVNRWDKGAAAKGGDKGREGSGRVKETMERERK